MSEMKRTVTLYGPLVRASWHTRSWRATSKGSSSPRRSTVCAEAFEGSVRDGVAARSGEAVITGASVGIGRATAEKLIGAGGRVALRTVLNFQADNRELEMVRGRAVADAVATG